MKRKPRFEYHRWGFEKVLCPHCSMKVSRNWFVRHIYKYHPELVKTLKSKDALNSIS